MDSLSSRVSGAEFTLTKRGYETSEVDDFVDATAQAVRALEEELTVANAKAAKLESRLRASSDADTVVQTAFLAAAEAKSKLLQEAEARSTQIIEAAKARAEAIEMAAAQSTNGAGPALQVARTRAKELEAEAERLLEGARQEAERIIAAAEEAAQPVAETDDEILDGVDAAREELHRIMWLLRTVKQAVLTGLAAAEEATPDLELVIDDSLELADVRHSAAEHAEG
jgi:DivIVA domain-containing protein